jgi:hypothetical protein
MGGPDVEGGHFRTTPRIFARLRGSLSEAHPEVILLDVQLPRLLQAIENRHEWSSSNSWGCPAVKLASNDGTSGRQTSQLRGSIGRSRARRTGG